MSGNPPHSYLYLRGERGLRARQPRPYSTIKLLPRLTFRSRILPEERSYPAQALLEEECNMTTVILAKRHSFEDAQRITAKFKESSFDDLHKVFTEGKAPTFAEIEGDTLGGFLALKPKARKPPRVSP